MTTNEKKGPKAQLDEWFDPYGNNVMGTGLTLDEFIAWSAVRRVHNAFSMLQDRSEVERRRELILDLSREIHALAPTRHYFSIRIAELALDAIILGDWEDVENTENLLTFDAEDAGLKARHYEAYAPIRAVLHRAWSEAPPSQRSRPELEVIPGGAG